MSTDADRRSWSTRWRWPLTLLGVVLVFGGLAGLLLQVEVGDASTGVERACGSAFDVIADRSGWQTWWARDLDEPDPAVRSALIRTTECSDAVDQRLVSGATAAALGVVLVGLGQLPGRRRGADAESDGGSLRVAGTVTAAVGIVLTAGGLVALTLLVADADSTLFLYTDRLVVALAGVIVLVPAIALIVGGWAIHAVGRRLDDG